MSFSGYKPPGFRQRLLTLDYSQEPLRWDAPATDPIEDIERAVRVSREAAARRPLTLEEIAEQIHHHRVSNAALFDGGFECPTNSDEPPVET